MINKGFLIDTLRQAQGGKPEYQPKFLSAVRLSLSKPLLLKGINQKIEVMAYSTELADRVRERLSMENNIEVEEKKMFSGLSFLVNGKMCINISHDNLMCRYNPELEDEVSEKKGFLPMIMKGKQLNGYCYVEPIGFQKADDFEYWIKICLDYNPVAKASKK